MPLLHGGTLDNGERHRGSQCSLPPPSPPDDHSFPPPPYRPSGEKKPSEPKAMPDLNGYQIRV